MTMDELSYLEKQKKYLERYETLCKRCGICCGANGNDPCVNLAKDEKNIFYCKIYDKRFGVQKTLSGKSFACVPIRDLIKGGVSFPGCVYMRKNI